MVADWFIDFLQLVLTALTFIAAIATPIVIIIFLIALSRWGWSQIKSSFRLTHVQLSGLESSLSAIQDALQKLLQRSFPAIFPAVLAGFTQIGLYALSKGIIAEQTKNILTIYLWVFVTLLTITVVATGWIRVLGVLSIVVATVLIVLFFTSLHDINSWDGFTNIFKTLWVNLESAAHADQMGIVLIASLVGIMLISSIIILIASRKKS